MTSTDAIVAFHRGRNPALLIRKWELLRSGPFTFFRGTAPLFYSQWSRLSPPRAPLAWICGDAHVENVGSYKGANHVAYFDLNDFDEACLAPVSWELGRALTGLYLMGRPALAKLFLEAYRATLASGKARHIEPEVAEGVVARLLESVQERTRKEFLAPRVRGGKLRMREGRSYPLDPATRFRAAAIFESWAAGQPDAAPYRVMDVCGRIAGNGSLGLERYAILVEGRRLPAIVDMKQAAPSATRPFLRTRQPRWRTEAERVATVQNFMQYVPAAHLACTESRPVSYVIRLLQPIEDRIDIEELDAAEFDDFVTQWAGVVASAHLRTAGWRGSANLDELMRYGRELAGERTRALLGAARQASVAQRAAFLDFRVNGPSGDSKAG